MATETTGTTSAPDPALDPHQIQGHRQRAHTTGTGTSTGTNALTTPINPIT